MTATKSDSKGFGPSQIICHPDKVEMFLQNSYHNVKTLPEAFPRMRQTLSDELGLFWRHEARRSREWQINGWNDDFRITFSGRSDDMRCDPGWPDNPFSSRRLEEFYSHHPYWYPGIIRLTTKTKTDPRRYCDYLSKFFALVEQLGIQEMPRIIECAIDIYGDPEPLKNSVRLVKDNPLQFCHYKDGEYRPGGSTTGVDTEYSMHQTFQPRRADKIPRSNPYHRELVCYPKPEHGMFRVELRLGYRYLKNFYDSSAYHTAIEAETIPALERQYAPHEVSRTLDLIGFLPYFVRTQLNWEAVDLEKLYKYHPNSRYWHLAPQSVRHIRYKLFHAGFSRRQVTKYTVSLPAPNITFVLPSQFKVYT